MMPGYQDGKVYEAERTLGNQKREGEIPSALNTLDKEVSRLGALLDTLSNRLTPVMRQEPVPGPEKETMRSYGCGLANELAALAVRLNAISRGVEIVTSKIEL